MYNNSQHQFHRTAQKRNEMVWVERTIANDEEKQEATIRLMMMKLKKGTKWIAGEWCYAFIEI